MQEHFFTLRHTQLVGAITFTFFGGVIWTGTCLVIPTQQTYLTIQRLAPLSGLPKDVGSKVEITEDITSAAEDNSAKHEGRQEEILVMLPEEEVEKIRAIAKDRKRVLKWFEEDIENQIRSDSPQVLQRTLQQLLFFIHVHDSVLNFTAIRHIGSLGTLEAQMALAELMTNPMTGREFCVREAGENLLYQITGEGLIPVIKVLENEIRQLSECRKILQKTFDRIKSLRGRLDDFSIEQREAKRALSDLIENQTLPDFIKKSKSALQNQVTTRGFSPLLLAIKEEWISEVSERHEILQERLESLKRWTKGGPRRNFSRDEQWWLLSPERERQVLEAHLRRLANHFEKIDHEKKAKILDILLVLRQGILQPLQAKEKIQQLFDPLATTAFPMALVEESLDPIQGDFLPRTQFRVGGPNGYLEIQSLRNWPGYREYVKKMQPNVTSDSGFLGKGEDWVECLLKNYETLEKVGSLLGKSAPELITQLADWLEESLIREGKFSNVEGTYLVRVNEQVIKVTVIPTRGHQGPPLPSVRESSIDYKLMNGGTGFKIKGRATEMHPDLIRLFGFPEGGASNPYALDYIELLALFTGSYPEDFRRMDHPPPVATVASPGYYNMEILERNL